MPDYRRFYLAGPPVFITCVIHARRKLFNDLRNVELLLETIKWVKLIHPHEMLAYVIMPDHIHLLLKPPEDNPNFSIIIHSIKRNFTINYHKLHSQGNHIPIWQSRFWDHVIRDEDDFDRHLDYIHWNPVKHGLSDEPDKYPWSTFQNWIAQGYYDEKRSKGVIPEKIGEMDFE